MAQVWVRAKSILRIEKNGAMLTFYPGDWAQMGRQQAREYLKNNQVEILRPAVLQTVQDLSDCTILLRQASETLKENLIAKYPGVPVRDFDQIPDRGRFLLWDTSANLRQDLILTGFGLLQKWQLAIPLQDYDRLAQNVSTETERAATEAVIHDLRVPLYDHRIIFARQCQEIRQLFELWQDGGDLAFLRALYQSRPVVNALPPSWVMA